jgi:hypothetical protein
MTGTGNTHHRQLWLPFPNGDRMRAKRSARTWIVAADGEGGTAFPSRLLTSPRHRHVFVDAGTGAPAFAATDIVLLRRAGDRFLVLLPEPTVDGFDCAVLERALENGRRAARRGQLVSDILALSFVPGRYAANASGARTGLERLLLSLHERASFNDPMHVSDLCRIAERGIDDRVEPAVRALFRREWADAVSALPRSAATDAGLLDAVRRAYATAASDFAQGTLHAHAARTLRRAASRLGALRQPELPGLPDRDGPPRSGRLGYAVQRLFALPLEFSGAAPTAGDAAASAPHGCAGEITITDQTLWRLVRQTATRRRRLFARLDPLEDRIRLRFGLRNELHAVLGLATDEPQFADTCAFWCHAPSLGISSQMMWLPTGAMADLAVMDPPTGHHLIELAALTGGGSRASLNLKFKFPLSHPVDYA